AGGVLQRAGAAELRGDGRIGSGTDPGVDQNRHGGLFQDDAQVVGVADAQTGTDQAGQRHYHDAAYVGQLAGNDGVVTGIDHDIEPFPDQHFGGLDGFHHVGEQGLLVGQHFQLDQIAPV